jgi:hypothetical protein
LPGFDIDTLTNFAPPARRCPCCLALWELESISQVLASQAFTCKVCRAYFSPPESFPFEVANSGYLSNAFASYSNVGDWGSYITGSASYSTTNLVGTSVDLGEDPLQHAMTLARMARQLRSPDDKMPPLRGLLHLLLSARSFIHLTTFGLDQFTLGMLETISQLKPIAAVASGVDPKIREILSPTAAEAPMLSLRIEGTKADREDLNHGKLIVVDGIVAVTGSVNLTRQGWRKAAASMEIVDVVTEIDRVRDLNNRYFSPLWSRLDPAKDERITFGNYTKVPLCDPQHPQYGESAEPSSNDEDPSGLTEE